MERKVGEIFEYNDEWYQCVGGTCRNCSFYYDTACKNITTIGSTSFGNCHCSLRTDNKSVIFKKLEKVGEPFYSKFFGKFYQMYKTYIPAVGCNFKIRVTPVEYVRRNEIFIETKQNKEE